MNAADKDERRRVILSLGSNINPKENMIQALDLLCQQTGIRRVSSAWETPAVGSDGPDFLNAAVWVETSLRISAIKKEVIRPIETQLGRVRTDDKNAPRTIDIDILMDQEEVVEPALWEYAFLAVPVSELLPDISNPQTGEPIWSIADRLAQTTRLKHRPEVIPGMWVPPDDCS